MLIRPYYVLINDKLSIRIFLQELMLPWVEKGLNKIPFFRDKRFFKQGGLFPTTVGRNPSAAKSF
jgi:hypothetical protein